MKFPSFNFEHSMANLTESLTRLRPVIFVRKLQAVLLVLTLSMVTYLLAIPFFGQEKIDMSRNGPFAVGKTASTTVTSSKEIIYDDIEKTEAAKNKAYESGAYIFNRNYEVLTSINRSVDEDIDLLKQINFSSKANSVNDVYANIPRWKNRGKEDIEYLVSYPRKEAVRELLHQSVNLLFSSSCILKSAPDGLDQIRKGEIQIRNIGSGDHVTITTGNSIIPRLEVYRNYATRERLNNLIREKIPNRDSNLIKAVSNLSFYYVYAYSGCEYNPDETEIEKIKKKKNTQMVKSKILANDVIVKAGDPITPETRTRLEILNTYATRANVASIISVLIIQIIFVTILIIFLKKYNPKRLNDVSSNVIVFSTIWILAISAYVASTSFYRPGMNYESIYYFGLFVPIGAVCLLISFMYDELMAVILGFYLSLFVLIASRHNSISFILAFTVTVVSSIYGRRLVKRIDFIKAGFLLSFVQAMIVTSGYLMENRTFWAPVENETFLNNLLNSNLYKLYVACLLNGFGSVTAAQFLLPVYEYIFNIPTRFKLLELADTGHPLLQELLTRAPSTYTHTFMVAALSERAAQNLGLDWLLTRAGVYYHDIGKIPNAGFFIENQHLIPKKENIDRNDPGKAAKIVIDHVLDGIEMAKIARLPRDVINFIPEHHGTSTMNFFYHKAMSELSPSQKRKINKADFAYPGPIPQRKETAIVMLADSLEAASRSMDEITPEALDELIQKIINIKLAENQLDESGITLGDLEVIKASFREVLLSSLHNRPKYPKFEETRELERQNNKLKNKKK